MIHQVNEIPVTYLNKGNIYSISIIDTAPAMPGSTPVQYRTSIYISFEETQQGPSPATRWNFWEEGRGTDEFHERGGKMQGVEYVEVQVVTEDDSSTRVHLETASLDRFSVLWTRGSGGVADCHIAVRFNFLSTDFSHSKGVKGIPSRLCAKTEIVSADSLYCSSEVPEICFCEVKVFRDHGAERKLANDITSITKSIDKLKQQIVQAETRIKESRKRKRNGSIAEKVIRSRPVRDPKHQRTQSISSASPTEEDLYIKLQMMQDILVSTQLVSLLNIRGQEQDHPDLHPIELTDEPRGQWSQFQLIAPTDDLQQSNSQHLLSPPDQPMDAQGLQRDSSGTPARWIGPFQVDCFYILYLEPQHSAAKEYYQVVYIVKREAKELIARIAAKCNFDPTSILQIVDLNQNRLNIKADKAAVYKPPEAQGMVLDLSGIAALPMRREWDTIADANFNSEDVRAVEDAIQSEGYLLKLIF
jgi:hypothetical protein